MSKRTEQREWHTCLAASQVPTLILTLQQNPCPMLSYLLKLPYGWQRASSIFLLDVALRIEPCLVHGRDPQLWLQWHLVFRWRIYDDAVDVIPWTMKGTMAVTTLQGDAGRLQASRQWYPSSWIPQNRQHGLASFLKLQSNNRQDSKRQYESVASSVSSLPHLQILLCACA